MINTVNQYNFRAKKFSFEVFKYNTLINLPFYECYYIITYIERNKQILNLANLQQKSHKLLALKNLLFTVIGNYLGILL